MRARVLSLSVALAGACTAEAPKQAPEPAPAAAKPPAPEPQPEPKPEPKPEPRPAAIPLTLEPTSTTEQPAVVWRRSEPAENTLVRERLVAADVESNRAWVLRAVHMHIEDLHEPYAKNIFSELLEIDLGEGTHRTVLRGVVGASPDEPAQRYGHLYPLVDDAGDLAKLGDLVAAGYPVADILVDPASERLYFHDSEGFLRGADRRGVAVELEPADMFALAFGANGLRAYATCDAPGDCEAEEQVFVERDGVRRRVSGLAGVDEIIWSATRGAFFASTVDEFRETACVYRIHAEGGPAERLACVGRNEDPQAHGVAVRFAPGGHLAMLGSFVDHTESVRRHRWLELERGTILAEVASPSTRQIGCLFDDSLALAVTGAGLAVFWAPEAGASAARGWSLPGQFSGVACTRFADGSVIALRHDLVEPRDQIIKDERGELVEDRRPHYDGRFSLVRVELEPLLR